MGVGSLILIFRRVLCVLAEDPLQSKRKSQLGSRIRRESIRSWLLLCILLQRESAELSGFCWRTGCKTCSEPLRFSGNFGQFFSSVRRSAIQRQCPREASVASA